MKKLIFLICSIFIASASNAMTIDEALKSKDVVVEAPSIYFSGGNAVSALNVCYTNNLLRTKTKVSLYAWQDGDDESPSLTTLQYFYTTIHYQKAMVDGDGTKWETRYYPLSFTVKLIDADTFREDYEKVIGTLKYTIPACE